MKENENLKYGETYSSKKLLIISSILVALWNVILFSSFSLIFACFLGMIWFDYFVSKKIINTLLIKRDVSKDRTFINDPITINYSVEQPTFQRKTLTFTQLGSTIASASSSRKRELAFDDGGKCDFEMELMFGRRGKKMLSKVIVSLNGPAGFYKLWATYYKPLEILVLPKIMDFEVFPLRLRELLPGKKSDFQLLEDTTDLKGVRKYSQDPLNRIHWKISARMNELFVKEFNYTATSRALIYVDLNLTHEVFARDVWKMIREKYEEEVIVAAASLVKWIHDSGHTSELNVVGKDIWTRKCDRRTDWVETVELLSMAEGSEKGIEITDVLSENLEKLIPSTTLVLFSMFLTDSILPLLIKAKSKCSRVIVLLLPFGYRDPRFLPARSFDLLPLDMRALEEKGALLAQEQIIVRIVRGNQSLQEVTKEIEDFH